MIKILFRTRLVKCHLGFSFPSLFFGHELKMIQLQGEKSCGQEMFLGPKEFDPSPMYIKLVVATFILHTLDSYQTPSVPKTFLVIKTTLNYQMIMQRYPNKPK